MNDFFSDPVGQKIISAFGPYLKEWRSLGGIERYTGLSQEQIQSYIENHSDWFLRSLISPGGIGLYRPNLDHSKVKA